MQQLKIEVIKKVILILILLTTLTNVSYASFPVTENLQTEIVRSANVESPTYKSGNPVWGILSLSCALLNIILIPNLLVIATLSLLGVIFGAIGFNKKLKGLAITGFILSLIFLIISLAAMLIIVAFGGVGSAFGG